MSKLVLHKVYNPHTMSKEAIIENFVIRLKPFEKIMKDIKNYNIKNSNQHFIIQGQRGSGKTTLLLRLKYEIEKLPNKIPVIFNEEEYGVTSLEEFWDRVWEILQDENYFIDIKELSYETLSQKLKEENKILILLIDNLGDILESFDEEDDEFKLREILQHNKYIKLIGGSPNALESYYHYEKPFYDFFNTITLEGLSFSDTIELLRQFSKYYEQKGVERIIQNDPKRVEILRVLTGGNPRTIALLFEIFADDSNGKILQDLEKLLDLVTALYKHRMEEFSKQHRKIVSAIAQNWEAITVKELVPIVKMESKALSAQINKLIKNDVIEKVPTSTKNNLYRIKERFFNIWYLMRYKRKNSDKIKWLIEFMDVWYSNEALLQKMDDYNTKLVNKSYIISESVKMTEALAEVYKKRFNCDYGDDEFTKVTDLYIANIDLLKELNEYEKYKDDLNMSEELYYFTKGTKDFNKGDLKNAKVNFEKFIKLATDMNNFMILLIIGTMLKNNDDKIYAYSKAIKTFQNEEKHIKDGMSLAYLDILTKVIYYYFSIKKNDDISKLNVYTELNLKAFEVENIQSYLTLISILILTNNFTLATDLLKNFLKQFNEFTKEIITFLEGIIFMLFSLKQYNHLYQLFDKFENLKKYFKSSYYANLKLLNKMDEYSKIPPEMEGVVNNLIEYLKNTNFIEKVEKALKEIIKLKHST